MKGTDIQVVLFGGTTEGRRLAELLGPAGVRTLLCTATEYGREQAGDITGVELRTGRMAQDDMAELLCARGRPLVVDATHPYAAEARSNIAGACKQAGAELLRVTRECVEEREDESVQRVESIPGAAQVLARTGESALLTVGSKELAEFCTVPGYAEKLFARVLPDPEVVRRCMELGFRGRNLIAVQGPFGQEWNTAMLRELGVDCLVTKDSGSAGGLAEKLSAAGEAGVRVLLVGRPAQEEKLPGVPLERAIELLADRFGLAFPQREEGPLPRFPAFVPLAGKQALIAGGGAVALRRARALLRFGALVTVVAPGADNELAQLARRGRITWHKRIWRPGDLRGVALAVAATDDREANRMLGEMAAEQGILVSVADRRDEGNFWFPALVLHSDATVGLVSPRAEHALARRAAQILREELGAE